jgi:hypothetical protein
MGEGDEDRQDLWKRTGQWRLSWIGDTIYRYTRIIRDFVVPVNCLVSNV